VKNNHTRLVVGSLLGFALLAVVHTWPMAAAPAHWSRVEGDGALNIWAIGWVGRTFLHHPMQIFEANIFYPEHLTLAYSEAMLVQGVFAMPVLALGGSAVLAYNVSLWAGLTLTGWAFCLLLRRWTGSWSAGLVGGSLSAFNAHTLMQFTHLQFLHAEFFAVMLYGLDRLIVTRELRHAGTLAWGLALQGLTSVYLLVFAAWTLLFAIASRTLEWWQHRRAMIARFAAAGALATFLLAPYLAAYAVVHETMGFVRSVEEEEPAGWANYLSTGSRLHFDAWSHAFVPMSTSTTFPGVAAIALMIVAFCDRRATSDPRFRMCAFTAAGCVMVSIAPLLPFYWLLHRTIPLFQAVRVLAHIGQVVLLMIAVMAGYGVASLEQAWKYPRSWPAIAAVLVVLVNGEALRAPVGYTWFDRVPAVYDLLAKEPGAVVVEVPFPLPQQWFLNGPYMVNSTRHWRPLLNGYSGFRPGSYNESYAAMSSFPADESLIALHQKGVTHIVVHQRAFEDTRGVAGFERLFTLATLQLIARDGDISILRLLP
jgi:hypothetical protein